MINYIYEVRFPQNPDPTFTQKFDIKADALTCHEENPGSEVYMLELDYDDYTGLRGIGNLVSEIQIAGPEMDANLADPTVPNSCEGDNDDNYDAVGKFRAPQMEDGLDEDVESEASMDDLVKELDTPITDAEVKHLLAEEDPKETEPTADSENDEAEMTDGELGEALFDALNNKGELTEAADEEADAPVATGNSATALIAALKEASMDFKTLHRHLVGGNWFVIHELLGDYYAKIDEFEDSIVENLLTLGAEDTVVDRNNLLRPKDYTEEEALKAVKDRLEQIQDLSVKTRTELNIPTAVAPAFDELENWIQIEAKYKLAHYFGDGTTVEAEPTEPQAPVTDPVAAATEPNVVPAAEAEAPVDENLVEDSAGMVDDDELDEDEEVCAWCGEAFDRDFLRVDRELGLLCPMCIQAIRSHEGEDGVNLEDEDEYNFYHGIPDEEDEEEENDDDLIDFE